MSRAQRSSSLPTIMHVRDATVGPLSGTNAVSTSCTSIASNGTPSASATICACIVRVPWPISVLRDEDARAGGGQLERRLRRQLDFAAAGESGAVEEQRQADASVGALPLAALLLELRSLDRFAQHRQGAGVLAEFLSGRGGVAGLERVDLAQAHGIDAELARRCDPCALRRRTASAARRSRGTRRWAACASSSRGRECGRDRSGTARRRESRRATAPRRSAWRRRRRP